VETSELGILNVLRSKAELVEI